MTFIRSIFSQPVKLLLPAMLLCAAANADVTFNFEGDALGTSTTFTNIVNGLSATFSSSADPGGFVVYPTTFETLTGNVLGDPGPAFANNLALNINFSQNLSAIELNFATSDFITPSPFTLSAYENSIFVDSTTSTGQFLQGFTFPEGEIAFGGANFNAVVLSSQAADFAVDNIIVAPVPAPEPADFAPLAAGLCLLAIPLVRRRKAARA